MANQSGGVPAIPKGKPTQPPKGRQPSPASDTRRSGASRKGSGVPHRPTQGRGR
jgi:hypothetical protein